MMTRKVGSMFLALWVALGLLALAGCAWESGGTDDDGGGDHGINYPPGPYGTGVDDTMDDLRVWEAICTTGSHGLGKAVYLSDLLGSNAIQIAVHAGWCGPCMTQAPTMEPLYQEYKGDGLKVLLIAFQDADFSSAEQDVIDWACDHRNKYGMTFMVTVDPGASVTDKYFRPEVGGTPLNMLLDHNMKIRFKMEGLAPESQIIQGNIEGILCEEGVTSRCP
jgi:thiol-disulfide isomerase/thioredoxin